MNVRTSTIEFRAQGNCDVVDITTRVADCIRSAEVQNGIVVIFVPGSTGGLTTVEYEPGLVKDLKEAFQRIAPQGPRYHHDDRWQDGNGHAHVRASLVGPSLAIPIVNGRMSLGTWQQVVFVDFDTRARLRELVVQMVE
ncbi:MAG: secondary thiamine-phosphate synthase enzyme YjbQ [Planctomycetota bacterium]|nr:secondary thiamine-phosphate synthase enzyme YjbQ [Planctomycetota bacterium]